MSDLVLVLVLDLDLILVEEDLEPVVSFILSRIRFFMDMVMDVDVDKTELE